MKAFFLHLRNVISILWTLPERMNSIGYTTRILHRRLDWYAMNSNRVTRRKLHRMLTNPNSPFHYTKPRSPIYIGKVDNSLSGAV